MEGILDPHFYSQVQRLFELPFPGRCFKQIDVNCFETSSPPVLSERDVYDHFKISLPYAGHTLVWEVRFDSSYPDFAPDFIFDDDSFTKYLTCDILSEHVPALENWNADNPDCFSNVLVELLSLYTKYQLQSLEKDGYNISVECDKLINEFNVSEDQLQVLRSDTPIAHHRYFSNSTRPPPGSISIMILQLEKQLPFSNIPEDLKQMALHFNIKQYSPNAVALYVNPALRLILGPQTELEIPNFSKSDGLSTFFSHFLSIIQETFSEVTLNYDKRQDFHLTINEELFLLGNVSVTPLESDAPLFTSSSYMIEANAYPVTLSILTPSNSVGNPKISMRGMSGLTREIKEAGWDVHKTVEIITQTLADWTQEDSESSS